MYIDVGGASATGPVREENQDHFSVGPIVEQCMGLGLSVPADSQLFGEYGLLVAVADGMGGYAGGRLASRVVLSSLVTQFHSEKREQPDDIEACVAEIDRYVEGAVNVLAVALGDSPENSEAGSTLTGLVLLPEGRMVVFWAGDTRLLRVTGGFARQLTTDHTPIGRDLREGRITEEQAAAMPVEAQVLTRSLGLVGERRLEYATSFSWEPTDVFLVCSDGVHGVGRGLPVARLSEAVSANDWSTQVSRRLVSEATDADGQDNATAVVVRFWET